MKKSLCTGVVFASLILSGCSSTPTVNQTQVERVESSIQTAKQESAYDYAPLAIQSAEQNYEDAQLAMQREDGKSANRLLDKAEVDADYALAKTQAEKAKQASNELAKTIHSLESNTLSQ